jgi:hypothetical protein
MNVKRKPKAPSWTQVVPKGSDTRREYMKRKYGHRLRALRKGKPIYFPPEVFNEVQEFCVAMARTDPDRPYVYAYEAIWELIKGV